jgi:hypothetical protein
VIWNNQELAMTQRINAVLFAGGLMLGAIAFFAPDVSHAAQERASSIELSAQQHQDVKEEKKKAAPAPHRAAPQRAAPHVAAPHRAAPHVAAPQRQAPRKVNRPQTAPHVVRHPTTAPRHAAPAAVKPAPAAPAAARVVTPHGTRAVTASRLRGAPATVASRTVIRGHNYSVWRGRYRIRHGNSWSTFVALGTLGAILIGSDEYYPYAYISAPEPYCEGLTEDGCELMWQEVQTIEGDVIDQCVAYCPWQ